MLEDKMLDLVGGGGVALAAGWRTVPWCRWLRLRCVHSRPRVPAPFWGSAGVKIGPSSGCARDVGGRLAANRTSAGRLDLLSDGPQHCAQRVARLLALVEQVMFAVAVIRPAQRAGEVEGIPVYLHLGQRWVYSIASFA